MATTKFIQRPDLVKKANGKPTAIYLACCYQGITKRINTGEKVEDLYWSDKDQQVKISYIKAESKGTEKDKEVEKQREIKRNSINSNIKKVKSEIDDIVSKARYNGIEPTLDYIEEKYEQLKKIPIQEEIKDFKYYLNDYVNNCINVVKKTKEQYNKWADSMIEFSEETGYGLAFEGMNNDFYNRYAKYILYEKVRRDQGKEEKGAYNNWFGNRIKKLKTFLRWCEDYRNITVCRLYRRFKVLQEDKAIIFYSREDINMLYSYQPPHPDKRKQKETDPGTKVYIDLTVFGSLTGLRISDILRYDYEVRNGLLQGKTKKTKGNFKIPFEYDYRIKEILDRYNWDFSKLNISESKINKHIKKIWKEVYEHHNSMPKPIKVYRYKLKDEFEFIFEKYELYSTHTNRRSFVSNMSRSGFSENDILKMLGSKSLKELRKYLANEDEFLLEKARKLIGIK